MIILLCFLNPQEIICQGGKTQKTGKPLTVVNSNTVSFKTYALKFLIILNLS